MFEPIKNKKVYQHVIEQVQKMVVEGVLKRGDKLPSERDLVEQLGVSRTSIREALRSLEIIGFIESRQGEGNFIKATIDSSFFEPISLMFKLNKGSAEDILETRMIIEVEAVALAAKRIKDEDITELQLLMSELRKAQNEIESSRVDTQLHYKIAEITGNNLIIILLNTISSLMESFIINAREMILREKEKREILLDQHQRIVDALVERNSEKAAVAMREHLETINETMKNLKYKIT